MDESEGPTCTDLVAGYSFSSIKVIIFHMMIDPLRGFEAKPVKLERGGCQMPETFMEESQLFGPK